MPSDACDAVPNRYARKAAAIIERPLSDARHAVGDDDARKAATRERPISDARHAVGDGNARKAAATTERLVSDARHATV